MLLGNSDIKRNRPVVASPSRGLALARLIA